MEPAESKPREPIISDAARACRTGAEHLRVLKRSKAGARLTPYEDSCLTAALEIFNNLANDLEQGDDADVQIVAMALKKAPHIARFLSTLVSSLEASAARLEAAGDTLDRFMNADLEPQWKVVTDPETSAAHGEEIQIPFSLQPGVNPRTQHLQYDAAKLKAVVDAAHPDEALFQGPRLHKVPEIPDRRPPSRLDPITHVVENELNMHMVKGAPRDLSTQIVKRLGRDIPELQPIFGLISRITEQQHNFSDLYESRRQLATEFANYKDSHPDFTGVTSEGATVVATDASQQALHAAKALLTHIDPRIGRSLVERIADTDDISDDHLATFNVPYGLLRDLKAAVDQAS